MILAWLAAVAWAQEVGPPVEASRLVPAASASRTLVVRDTDADLVATARVWGDYARDELVRTVDGVREARVRDDGRLVLTAAAGLGPVRLGGGFAGHVVAGAGSDGARVVAGDPWIDLEVTALRSAPGRPGLAFAGRVQAPLGSQAEGLGMRGWRGSLDVVVDGRVGPVWLGGQVGYRLRPRVDLDGLRVDDEVGLGLGAAVDVGDGGYLSLEGVGAVGVLGAVQPETTPLELLVGGGWRDGGGGRLHAALGTALTPGIGAPVLRVVVGGAFRRGRGDARPDP